MEYNRRKSPCEITVTCDFTLSLSLPPFRSLIPSRLALLSFEWAIGWLKTAYIVCTRLSIHPLSSRVIPSFLSLETNERQMSGEWRRWWWWLSVVVFRRWLCAMKLNTKYSERNSTSIELTQWTFHLTCYGKFVWYSCCVHRRHPIAIRFDMMKLCIMCGMCLGVFR